MADESAGELRGERREDRLVPHRLAHVEEERRVRDHSRLGRAHETARQQLLQVHRGLVGLDDRQRVLHAAVLRGDRADALPLHGDHRAGATVHRCGQHTQIELGGRRAVDERDAGEDVDHGLGESRGLGDLGLVLLRRLLEAGLRVQVTLDDRDEVHEELPLRVLRHLRPIRVERGERRHRAGQEQTERREPVGRVLGARTVEDGRVRVELGVDHPDRLHRGREAVRVGVGDDHRPRLRELAYADERRARRIGPAIADDGVLAEHQAHLRGGVGDRMRPRIRRVHLVVVIPNDDLEPVGLEGLDGRREFLCRRRVDEDDPPRPLRDGGQDGLAVGRREELRADDQPAANLKLEHLGILLPRQAGWKWVDIRGSHTSARYLVQ